MPMRPAAKSWLIVAQSYRKFAPMLLSVHRMSCSCFSTARISSVFSVDFALSPESCSTRPPNA